MAIVCAGVPEARFALRSDPPLRSRVADVALPPWTDRPELRAFVALLVQGLPLRRPSPVDSAPLRRLLIERSGGLTLSICRAIERAGTAAIRNGREFIDLAALQDGVSGSGPGKASRPDCFGPPRCLAPKANPADGPQPATPARPAADAR